MENNEDAATSVPVRRQGGASRPARATPAHRLETGVDKTAGEEAQGEGDWREEYMRLAAEIENTKKRLARNAEKILQEERKHLLAEMLPVADNLDRILAYANPAWDPDLNRGLEIARQDLMARLRKYGVEPIAAEGKAFDPEWHEAVGALPAGDTPSGTVVRVEQEGYRLDGQLLRPAQVLIAQ